MNKFIEKPEDSGACRGVVLDGGPNDGRGWGGGLRARGPKRV